jgi:hypothetical protein
VLQAQAGVQYAFGTVARANPIVVAWRWRYELAATAALAAGWIALGTVAGAAITVGLVTALTSTAAHWPRGRRFLAAHAWRIVTPHRVRVGCAQAWIHSRNGKIPIVVLTARQPFGERVYLWCRAGTSAEDLASARGLLAAACWATDIRVARSPHYAHLVTLDVIRRGRPGTQAAPDGLGACTPPGLSWPLCAQTSQPVTGTLARRPRTTSRTGREVPEPTARAVVPWICCGGGQSS